MSVGPASAWPDQAKATRLPSGDNAGAPSTPGYEAKGNSWAGVLAGLSKSAPGERDGDHCSDDRQSADGDPRAPEVGNRRRLLRLRENNRRSRVRGRRGGIRFEGGHVAALRQRDDDGIGSALVVLAQFVAEPPRVDPNDRIGTAVEVRPLPVQLVGEDRFLERVSLPVQALFNDEREEAPQLLGSRKDLAGEDSLQLSADYVIRQVASRLGACVSFGGHRAPRANGRGVYSSVRRHFTSPFPEVEHRRDLAPPDDMPQCSSRSTSPPAGRPAVPSPTLRKEAPWLDRTSACRVGRHDRVRDRQRPIPFT